MTCSLVATYFNSIALMTWEMNLPTEVAVATPNAVYPIPIESLAQQREHNVFHHCTDIIHDRSAINNLTTVM